MMPRTPVYGLLAEFATPQEVLAAAPDVQDGRFRVPRILGEAP